MLPEGWQRSTLGEIARITSGGTPDRSESGYWAGSIPWVTTGEIQFNTITDTAEKITEAGLKNSSAKLFPPGTLLMAMYGQGKTRGQVAKLGIEASTNQACAAMLFNEGHDPDFYFQYLSSQYTAIRELGNAGTQQNLNGSILKGLAVPVPPHEEQRSIARMLAIWDQAIATVEGLISNARKQWHHLLSITLSTPSSAVAARGASDSNVPPSVQPGIPRVTPTPQGWRRTHLGAHLRETRRPAELDPDREYALVTVKRSRGGVQAREILRGAEVKTPTQFFIKQGDFLISKRQIVHGACGVVPPELDGAIVSNEYAVLNTDGEIDLHFLRYLSESTYFQQTCFHSSIGIHVEKMVFKTERWLTWPFNIPPLSEQRRIVALLDTAQRELGCLRRQMELLKLEKSVLMADLLTGKRRLPLPAVEAEIAA